MTDTGPKVLVESRILKGSSFGGIVNHLNGTGEDHTFIDQDLTTTATPEFAGVDLTGTLDMNSNVITNLSTPVALFDAASKFYVDTLFKTIGWLAPVRVGSTVAGTLASDFENGDTIDDVVLETGDRILIKNQVNEIENGIYTVNSTGAPNRASDFDTGIDASGYITVIKEGTINDNISYICTNNSGSALVGTDSLSFDIFGSKPLIGGDGINVTETTSSTIDIVVADFAGTNLEDDGSNNLRIAATAAGAGLTGGGASVLAVGAGDGITVNANDVQVNVSDLAGTNLEDDGLNNLRIAATAAGAGLTGGGVSVLAVGAGDGITVNANDVQVNVSDFAGTGLEDDLSNNLRIASTVAGDGLTGGSGTALSVVVSDIAGTNLEDDGLNNLRIAATAAGAGLTGGGASVLAVGAGDGITVNANDVQVTVSDFAGTGLENDGSNNLRIASSVAGDGLTGGSGTALSVVVNDFAGTNLENDGSNNLRIAATAAGAGLTGGGVSVLAVGAGDGITVNANDVQVAVSDFAGTGLENDGSNNLRIASSVAGDGLTGGSGTALSVAVSDIAGTGLENDGSNNLRISTAAAGTNLTGGGGSALAVNLTANTYYVTSVAELNSAITAIGVSTNPSKILMAPGTYTLTAGLVLPNKVVLQGSGKEVTTFVSTSRIDAGSNCIISDISIDGNNSINVTLIRIRAKTDILIKNCEFRNTQQHSILIDQSSDRVSIINCDFNTLNDEFSDASGIAVDTNGCNTLLVDNCRFNDVNNACYAFTGACESLTVTNCYFTSCSFTITIGSASIIVKNNIFDTNAAPLFLQEGTNGCIVEGNIFIGSSGSTAINSTVSNLQLVNNRFITISGNAVTTSASNVIVAIGNYFEDITNHVFPTTTSGMNIISNNYCDNVGGKFYNGAGIISNNQLVNMTEAGGYIIESGSNNSIIEGNYISGSGAFGIYGKAASSVFNNMIDPSISTPFIFDAGASVSQNICNVTIATVTTNNVTAYASKYTITAQATTSGTLTVPNLKTGGYDSGYRLRIELDSVTSGDVTVTPTSFANGTSILLDTSGEYIVLEWSGDEWRLIENGSANTPTFTINTANSSNTSTRTVTNYRIDTVGQEVTFHALFTITPTASATTTSFTFTLPRRSTVAANTDVLLTGSGYDSGAGVALENLFVRGNSATNGGFCQFTSNSTSANQIVSISGKYTAN